MRLLIAGLLVRVQSGEPYQAPGQRIRWSGAFLCPLSEGRGALWALFTPVPEVPLGSSAAAAGHQRQGPVRHAAQRTGQGRVKSRDYDGLVRLVSKVGPSRAAAGRALKAELTIRRAPVGVGAITSATRMATVADAWMEADHGWSTGTQRTYGS